MSKSVDSVRRNVALERKKERLENEMPPRGRSRQRGYVVQHIFLDALLSSAICYDFYHISYFLKLTASNTKFNPRDSNRPPQRVRWLAALLVKIGSLRKIKKTKNRDWKDSGNLRFQPALHKCEPLMIYEANKAFDSHLFLSTLSRNLGFVNPWLLTASST